MITIHSLGFPRIGKKRELKFALEKFWRGDITQQQLEQTGRQLRQQNWREQSALDLAPVGDFSFYDQILDASFLFGNHPARVRDLGGDDLANYFRVARGRAHTHEHECACVQAGEMTKWFDTNYHYIVPEFSADTRFNLHADALLEQVREAQAAGVVAKPVLVGPVTYLWLGKSQDHSDRLTLLEPLLAVYLQLLSKLAAAGVEWVQIDEPILVTELDASWRQALNHACHQLKSAPLKLLLATYFGELQENLQLACELPVDGLHIDAINGRDEVARIADWLPGHKVLSVGVINGRNIWKTDLTATLVWLEPLHQRLGQRLWLAPSCSLLHVPVDLASEQKLDDEIKQWLAFAVQKLDELRILATALNEGRAAVADELAQNAAAVNSRRQSGRIHRPAVKQRVAEITAAMGQRLAPYAERSKQQRNKFRLPLYPTTTIGSFPQTAEIRKARRDYRVGELGADDYRRIMRDEIAHCVHQQEALGLDVLVHGEPERNDMVEYFGEQLDGYAFSQHGWVQSYGSRCVKPPILFGDISRPRAMTVDWISWARSLTDKPMKGMLTGPATMLNWSFVRDDQPRSQTCLQLSLAIRDEVLDLEKAGIDMIQIDEAALREGLPLRRSQWQDYLDWAIQAFRISANGVRNDTQIHTHMCYSEFNDIMPAIADMDADVITIETSRSNMELLAAFEAFEYPNEIGPGVYDIHSPNIPDVDAIVALMKKAAEHIPPERLWVNPDCGLKTRNWEEVLPALTNMVTASRILAQDLAEAV